MPHRPSPGFTIVTGGEPAAAESSFALCADGATAMNQPEAIAKHYVLYFNDSLRGLSVGAPVTLLGLEAGEVTDLPNLEDKLTGILGKVDKIPFEAIGIEIKQVLATLDTAIKDIDKAVDHIDTGVTP